MRWKGHIELYLIWSRIYSHIELHIKLKQNIKNPSFSIVNAGPPDILYLYYLLNMEGVTLTGSLSPDNASKTWVISKNKVFTNTNCECICTNVIFKDLCEFIQNRILQGYTCPKSISNGEKQEKLLHNFTIQVKRSYDIIFNKIERLCLKPFEIDKTSKFLHNWLFHNLSSTKLQSVFIIFWDFSMFYQIFLSPHVK